MLTRTVRIAAGQRPLRHSTDPSGADMDYSIIDFFLYAVIVGALGFLIGRLWAGADRNDDLPPRQDPSVSVPDHDLPDPLDAFEPLSLADDGAAVEKSEAAAHAQVTDRDPTKLVKRLADEQRKWQNRVGKLIQALRDKDVQIEAALQHRLQAEALRATAEQQLKLAQTELTHLQAANARAAAAEARVDALEAEARQSKAELLNSIETRRHQALELKARVSELEAALASQSQAALAKAPTELPAAAPAAASAAAPEGLRPPDALFETPPAEQDDLSLIRGIGAKSRQQLYDLGIYQFRQLAVFSDDDLCWLEQQLPNVGGRIRRDGWVAQAAELALQPGQPVPADPATRGARLQ